MQADGNADGTSRKAGIGRATAGGMKAGEKGLVKIHHAGDGGVLADDLAAQGGLELADVVAAESRVQEFLTAGFHNVLTVRMQMAGGGARCHRRPEAAVA